MKIRRFMSMYMFLALVFSNAIAMMPDNPDNNKRKREDGNSFEMNKKREIDKKGEPLEEKVKPNDSLLKSIEDFNCDNFFEWESKKKKIIEKDPEGSLKENQNFNSNTTQNNLQENGSKVPTQAVFNAQIIPKPIVPKAVEKFNYEAYLEWEKSNERNLQGNQKINGNNVVNNMIINGPVSISIQQQQQPFSPGQMMVISQLLQQQQQQSQQVVSQQNIDIPSNVQGPSNVLIPEKQKCGSNFDENKEIKNIKAPYITIRHGSPYCLVCKKRVLKPATHKACKEHLINASAGENILKKELQAPLECKFPDCNKVFNDIDDFIDHMFVDHVDTNGRCTHPKCFEEKDMQRVKREHFSLYHVNSKSKKFFRCPFCKNYESKTMRSLFENHLLCDKKCSKCSECLKQIIKKSKN